MKCLTYITYTRTHARTPPSNKSRKCRKSDLFYYITVTRVSTINFRQKCSVLEKQVAAFCHIETLGQQGSIFSQLSYSIDGILQKTFKISCIEGT